jgi:hypothetical protein
MTALKATGSYSRRRTDAQRRINLDKEKPARAEARPGLSFDLARCRAVLAAWPRLAPAALNLIRVTRASQVIPTGGLCKYVTLYEKGTTGQERKTPPGP